MVFKYFEISRRLEGRIFLKRSLSRQAMDAAQRELLMKALSESAGLHQETADEVRADLPEKRYEIFTLDASAVKRTEPADTNLSGRIAFIDGGNAELIRAPHLSLQLIRICSIIYSISEGKPVRKETHREEFFVLVRAVRNPDLRYEAHLFRKGEGEVLSFNPADRSLLTGAKRAEPSAIGGVVRRFSELRLAGELASQLSGGDAVVLDGTLEATYPGEAEVLDGTAHTAAESGITLAALAKRCSLLTSAGRPLLWSMARLAHVQAPWSCGFARGTAKGHRARLYGVKLHEKARHHFRLDIHEDTFDEYRLNGLLACLALHAREATFPGYPYGLIEADRMARVSNQQRRYHRTLLESRLGKQWHSLKEAMSSLDAHDILDSM